MAAASGRHAARLMFQSASVLIDSALEEYRRQGSCAAPHIGHYSAQPIPVRKVWLAVRSSRLPGKVEARISQIAAPGRGVSRWPTLTALEVAREADAVRYARQWVALTVVAEAGAGAKDGEQQQAGEQGE